MRSLHIIPEFEEGGVERHFLHLSQELLKLGHGVGLATAGGKLESQLPPEIRVYHLPVQRKNPITGLWCVLRLAAARKGWDLLHAHSRVPAWVAWWTSAVTGIPWVMTAHAPYSLNAGLTPLPHADGVISVSEPVREHLAALLPPRSLVIPNGVGAPSARWNGLEFPKNPRFLFVGYLARRKGLDVALRALGELRGREWTLDVLGDGSQKGALEALAAELGIGERVFFHGFRDDVEDWMARSGCLLFPSHQEGMGLVVLEALTVGLPVLASDLEPLRPLASGPLLPPGDTAAWREALTRVLDGGPASPLSPEGLISFSEMARRTEGFYEDVLRGARANAHR